MFNRLFLFLLLLATLSSVAPAQSTTRGRSTVFDDAPTNSASSQRDDAPPLGSPEAEMIARRGLAAEEAAHKEHTNRAREAAQLGAELLSAFERNKVLDRVDLKKLERLEKLSRRIRSRAGGSYDGDALGDAPRDMGASLARLAELSDELRKAIEKTSRQVISTAIIERTNELIALIDHIRNFVQR